MCYIHFNNEIYSPHLVVQRKRELWCSNVFALAVIGIGLQADWLSLYPESHSGYMCIINTWHRSRSARSKTRAFFIARKKITKTIAGNKMNNIMMERDASLVDLRKMTGGAIKQAVVAHQMAINESAVSKLERKRLVDSSLSKVKKYIEAIGGELDITVKMPDGQLLKIA